jgi:hypothetical protein
MVSVFRNDRVENLAAGNTPPSPEGEPGPVIFLVDHPSLTTMTFHGDLLGKRVGKSGKFGEPLSPREIQKSVFPLPPKQQEICQPQNKFFKINSRGDMD